jgi:hypothetical protein
MPSLLSTAPTIIDLKILTSAIASQVISPKQDTIDALVCHPEVKSIARSLDATNLIRRLNLARASSSNKILSVEIQGNNAIYDREIIGEMKILYKSPLPGELQARLAVESTIDRFIEYLQKVYRIILLDESDRHVRVFIPGNIESANFFEIWEKFIREVIFSDYGNYQLPGLVQTFAMMLNTVTLSARGFSTVDVPILTLTQAQVLSAWYYAVIRDVKRRQTKRQQDIDKLQQSINDDDLSEKDLKSAQKALQDKEEMQAKEAKKYTENFEKSFVGELQEQSNIYREIESIDHQLTIAGITKPQHKKLQIQQTKLMEKIVFRQDFIREKLKLIDITGNDPFGFVELDERNNPDRFSKIKAIAKTFTKTATDQINSTRGDIFTQCISEMYRLLEMKAEDLELLPPPLLTERLVLPELRSPGDDSREFCYACGMTIDAKKARWQVLRFIFERPSQRRQSASSEGRPHICASCAALAFASPLKVTDESIVLKLSSKNDSASEDFKVKDYIRMLTNKELHLSAGRYLVLASEKTGSGDVASKKLGQVQYALAKVASIFPLEVLSDFKFSLIIQGSRVPLAGRHLVFLKGLMTCYRQFMLISGKDVNMPLGDAIRYIQQDLPYIADYRLTKESSYGSDLGLEQVRILYWEILKKDIKDMGDYMESDNQIPKRARLYRDVAALTGITYAFVQSLENTAKKLAAVSTEEDSKKAEDIRREVKKIIEEVDDAISFGYFATYGDLNKTRVQAWLYHDRDSDFVYSQTKWLLDELNIVDREYKDDKGKQYIELYADDILRSYHYFALNDYAQEKDWKELTYNLQLSLYTRFPELVRKPKPTGDK